MIFCTNYMLFNIVLFIIGIVCLVKGSDWFVDAASIIAERLHVSDLIIGLTVVSLGTSMPELATNLFASFYHNNAIVYGNVIGSNFTNVMLVLGTGAFIMGYIKIKDKKLFYRDGTIMISMTLITWGSAVFLGGLPRWLGVLYLVGLAGYLALLLNEKKNELRVNESDNKFVRCRTCMVLLFLLFGLLMIFMGAKVVVDNVIWFSGKLGIPQAVIAVTVVALGTSLPELAVTVAGIIKKHNDLALGNIVGSNIFNLMLILGLSAVIHPLTAFPEIRNFNLPMLVLSDLLLLVFMRWGWNLNRWKGAVFLLGYVAFLCINFSCML